VLRIFIVLQNPSPRPGLNTRPFGPVPSTLTTTPPRQLRQHRYSTYEAESSQPCNFTCLCVWFILKTRRNLQTRRISLTQRQRTQVTSFAQSFANYSQEFHVRLQQGCAVSYSLAIRMQYVFICSLFSDAFTVTPTIQSNERVVSE
jgi:hypothetical protein